MKVINNIRKTLFWGLAVILFSAEIGFAQGEESPQEEEGFLQEDGSLNIGGENLEIDPALLEGNFYFNIDEEDLSTQDAEIGDRSERLPGDAVPDPPPSMNIPPPPEKKDINSLLEGVQGQESLKEEEAPRQSAPTQPTSELRRGNVATVVTKTNVEIKFKTNEINIYITNNINKFKTNVAIQFRTNNINIYKTNRLFVTNFLEKTVTKTVTNVEVEKVIEALGYKGAVPQYLNIDVGYEFVRAQRMALNNQYEQALLTLNEIEKVDPGNTRLYNMRGSIYYKLGFYDFAIDNWEKSLLINPKQILVRKYLNKIKLKPF